MAEPLLGVAIFLTIFYNILTIPGPRAASTIGGQIFQIAIIGLAAFLVWELLLKTRGITLTFDRDAGTVLRTRHRLFPGRRIIADLKDIRGAEIRDETSSKERRRVSRLVLNTTGPTGQIVLPPIAVRAASLDQEVVAVINDWFHAPHA
ncbi:hypothetical protein AADZ90_004840 [Aestuariibius sp. 2305UL40-4]|uniref:hypothetical protein n=1 Tax=Aestuariibius violaceus TaxID=3234132 RepID=UPI00345E21FA